MIQIRLADKNNFSPDSLDDFDRYQEVTDIYRPVDGQLRAVRQPFTDDWSPERKREKAAEILSGAYITRCAFDGDRVAGFLMLLPELDRGRMIVSSFHVSREYRRKGLGRALLKAAAAEARKRNAAALYISACSSRETIDFYTAMGCRISKDPIPALAEKEPYDIQMELDLAENGI